MPKPVCVKCKIFFRMKKGGFYWTEGMPWSNEKGETLWRPYKVWSGDLWECKGCGTQIVSGSGFAPVTIQHMTGFEDMQKRVGADKFQVNDC